MPRPIRLRKPPSAPSATTAAATTTTTTTTAAKKAPANTIKSRITRSGIKDISDHQFSVDILVPSSDDVPAKKSSSRPVVAKRSTRSRVVDEPAASPSPRKQPATRIRKSKKVAPEFTKEATPTPLLPAPSLSPLPSSPEIQVPASSDAENHSPRHFASSPPPLLSTPPRTKRRVVLEFGSDAGYSPPPPTVRPTSAERPRLRELQPVSLEPFDSLLPENVREGDETDDTIDPRASPTPKRGKKLGLTPAAEDYEDEPPTSAQPPRRALPPPTGGVGFFVDGEESEFIIYSDPGSPTPSLPPAGIMDDNMRPPESSPAPTPVKQRKRRSSGAVVDSDEDNGDSQDETELAAGRGGKKQKGKTAKEKQKVRLMPTSALMDLLPRRKRNTRASPVDEFDILSTSEDSHEQDEDTRENGSEDELSKLSGRNTRSGRGAKRPAAKAVKGKGKVLTVASGKGVAAKGKGKGIASAAVTKNAWSKPLSGKPGKTYARRSTGSEKENDSPNMVRGSRGGRDQAEKGSDGDSSDTIVVADGVVEKNGRRKLKEVVEKFKEVDRWEMEFEDLSPRSLEVGSEVSGR